MTKWIVAIALMVAPLAAGEANDDPQSVAGAFFNAAATGNVVAAESLFRCTNDAQRAHVHAYVTNATAFFASGKVVSRPVAAFVGTNAAVVAIEQTHADMPGRREIERGCLLKTTDGWRLLPDPESYGASINGITLSTSMEFNRLSHDFHAYRRAERKKDKDRNPEQPPP